MIVSPNETGLGQTKAPPNPRPPEAARGIFRGWGPILTKTRMA